MFTDVDTENWARREAVRRRLTARTPPAPERHGPARGGRDLPRNGDAVERRHRKSPEIDTLIGPVLEGTAPGTSDGTFPVLDPPTGEPLAENRNWPPRGRRAIDRAAAATAGLVGDPPRTLSEIWPPPIARHSTTPRAARAHLMSLEMGRTRGRPGRVRLRGEFFRWFAERPCASPGAPHRPGGATGSHRAARSGWPAAHPWNFPGRDGDPQARTRARDGVHGPAQAGRDTPLTALYLADLLARAGLPDGVVSLTTTRSPAELVRHALADPDPEAVVLARPRSPVALRQAAERIVNTSLELGGNARSWSSTTPTSIPRSRAMFAKMRNGGQACAA
ncbi:aldehyde dehydrogenase family protein [Pseudonocardia sp. MCCB 268]|nr:aldehyde dehydrogenase family protein [Pseudonocardia cytotoxica]